jgi:hypothetical protein
MNQNCEVSHWSGEISVPRGQVQHLVERVVHSAVAVRNALPGSLLTSLVPRVLLSQEPMR